MAAGLIFHRRISSIEENENLVRITLYEISIIRKRPNANIPCDLNKNSNDDDHWRKAALSFLGCLPPYWTTFSPQSNFSLPTCNSSTQLKDFYLNAFNDLSNMYTNISVLYTSPCDDMSITPTFYVQPHSSPDKLVITVKYPGRSFKEITNRRAFNVESFWSGVGGFVGIFLGYSLLQLPEMLCTGFQMILARYNDY